MKNALDESALSPRGAAAPQAEIVVTRGNPSRGRGYEIAHFCIGEKGVLRSLSDRDVFVNNLTAAASWVLRQYPSAHLCHGRKNHRGRLAALRFTCALSDLLESRNGSGSHSHPGLSRPTL